MLKDIPDNLKNMLMYYNINSDFFSDIQLVNLKIISESILNQLGYAIPLKSKIEFSAALEKGSVTLPVEYGSVKNEIYDIDGNYVCCLDELK